MRFDRLEVVRWGTLEDVSLDFSGDPCLHVVFGDNEAGKSTIRRAISAVLFGIPPQSTDRGKHGYASLRLGATVRQADGRSLAFWRRKGTKDTLRDAADAPLADGVLGELLAGVDRETFEREWSLDHARMRSGGEALLRGEGELGQSLLTAGLGGASVTDVQRQLEAEARELFFGNRPSEVARLLEQIRQARQAREAHAVHVKRAEAREASLSALRSRRAALEQERERMTEEAARLDTIARLVPLLEERARVTAALSALPDVPELSPDFGRRLAAAQPSQRSSSHEHEVARADVLVLTAELDGIVVDESVLEARASIEGLVALDREMRDWRERASLASSAVAAAHQAVDAIGERCGASRDVLERLARGDHRARHRRAWDLVSRTAELDALERAVEEDVAREERVLAALESRREPGADDVPAELSSALDDARRELGAVEERLADATSTSAHATKVAQEAFDALPRWSHGPLGRRALETSVLPSMTELVEASRRLQVEGLLSDARAAEAVAMSEVARLSGELAALGSADCVDEAALRSARQERDGVWTSVRGALESGDTSAAKRMLGGYEEAVRRADSLADDLRLAATRTAGIASTAEAKRSAALRLDRSRNIRVDLETKAADAHAAWADMWRRLSLDPDTPDVMRAWLEEAERVRALFDAEANATEERRLLEQRASAAVAVLARLLGRTEADDAPGRHVLVVEASRRLEARARRQELLREIDSVGGRLVEARGRTARILARREATEAERRTFVADLGASADTTPEQAVSLLEAVAEAAPRLTGRDEALDRRAEACAREETSRRHAIALLATIDCGARADLDGAASTLGERLQRASDAQAARATAVARLEDARRRLDGAVRTAEAAELALRLLCVEAGVDDADGLARADADAERRRKLRTELGRVEREIAALPPANVPASPTSLEDVLAARRSLQDARRTLDERIKDVSQEIGGGEQDLASVAGGSAAAEDDVILEGLVATLGEVSQRYLRLAYAAWLLAHGAEAYRQRNQNTMLRRAGDTFRRVTRDSFLGVVVDDEDGGRGVIKGVREQGGLVSVEAMSEGTRDQLFLSLRLAALESTLDRRGAVPFVLDDVLVNLDDARATATLDALADLAGRTQVILFTHHARVAELAAGLAVGRVRAHRLEGRRP